MNLQKYTKKLCDEYNIAPARSKGQNFLVREDIYDSIIESANISKDDIILEVGPGFGFLTERLARVAKKVIAVELDDKLAGALRDRLLEFRIKNVEVININVLDFDIRRNFKVKLGFKTQLNFKIVANLPYNITSVFLRKFLGGAESRTDRLRSAPEFRPLPRSFTLMLQKEVAERIAAKPPKMSLLAISVQMHASPEIVKYVNRDCFWPEPAVDSAILRLNTKETNNYEVNEKEFFRLVKSGFSHKRKMLKNNLAISYQISQDEASLRIKKAGFSEKVRAQELGVENWVKLLGLFSRNML